MPPQITREPQLYTGSTKTTDGRKFEVKIDYPHPLFDVPLDEAVDAFMERLGTYYKPVEVHNAYRSGKDDDPLQVFEHVAESVIGLDESDHDVAKDVAADNVYGHNPTAFQYWEDLAEYWLNQYLNAYNRRVVEESPDSLETLRTCVKTLDESGKIETEHILEVVRKDLED